MAKFKPDWCLYNDCLFIAQSQKLMCIGKLPKPTKHNEGVNTHRFCLDERETKHGIHDLQNNWSDAWNMIRLLNLANN